MTAPLFTQSPWWPAGLLVAAMVLRLADLWYHRDHERVVRHLGLRGDTARIAAAAMSRAGSGEVLASSAVRELIAGSGVALEERGALRVPHIAGEWRLYLVGDGSPPGHLMKSL